MGVNAAAFIHHGRHKKSGDPGGFLVPSLGFLICAFIWINLSLPAKVLGAVWMAVGIIYGAIRTCGFRAELVTFEVPSDIA
jgi:hypothetical protein